MLAKLIDWSGRNPFLVLLVAVFIVVAGVVAVMRTPIDALPDLSDVQVIVYTEYPGQAPQVVEDQVTYPLTTAMLSVPFALAGVAAETGVVMLIYLDHAWESLNARLRAPFGVAAAQFGPQGRDGGRAAHSTPG